MTSKNNLIAVIRIRRGIHMGPDAIKTLKLLRLHRQNYCVVMPKTESIVGMVERVRDYVTYGDISHEVYDKLKQKRLETFTGRDGKKQEKKFFRLQPPVKGFERKGIKQPFNKGGALGDRKEKIDDLLLRMM